MLQELEDLSNALDQISEEEARNIVDHINRGLKDFLNAQIIDILYKEEARGETIILRPMSSIVTAGFRDEALPLTMGAKSIGIWPAAFYEKKIIWLEKVKETKKAETFAKNEADDVADESKIKVEHINEIYDATDSILCTPLVFEQAPVGIFSLEFSRSGILDIEIIKYIKRLSISYACLAWKVSASSLNRKQTRRAIEHFKTSVSQTAIREHIRFAGNGILLRPFGENFNDIQRCVIECFRQNKLELQHFDATPGRAILDELIVELRVAPFAVIDLSGLNPNVLIELGMAKILDKELMLLRRKDDKSELPFYIQMDQIDHYHVKGNDVHVEEVGTGKFLPLCDRINAFIRKLRRKGVVQ